MCNKRDPSSEYDSTHYMELRKINHLVSNIPILDLPNKVFGYSYGHVFRNFKNDFSNLVIQKGNPSSTELRFFFEVRKYTSTDVRLVGYISDEAQLIYSESGFKKNKIILFPFAYQEFKNRLEICLSNQSLFINDRNIESTTFGEISILEISSSTLLISSIDISPKVVDSIFLSFINND